MIPPPPIHIRTYTLFPYTTLFRYAQLATYVYCDTAGSDLGTVVANLQRAVAQQVTLPPGTTVAWSGPFEYLASAMERLKVVVPIALVIILDRKSTRLNSSH